jgi:Na+-transporting methylmalonyl-CoA/oxaloacetate decarboxylase gamma subunit
MDFLILLAANSNINSTDLFTQKDPHGIIMAAIGMTIVFSVLIMLYLIFSKTPVLYTFSFRQHLKMLFKYGKKFVKEHPVPIVEPDELSGEVNAAIATAIYLYRSELHDFEDTVLTIKKVSRTYSPWSSKIYGVRNPLLK